jgi:hypothetical protein
MVLCSIVPVSSPDSSPPSPADYRLAPAVVARVVGLTVIGLALLMFVGTMVIALAGLSVVILVVLLVVGLVAVFALGWYLRSRAWMVRCSQDGYRVRWVRGAGVTGARWSAVEDAVATTRHDIACVVLRLRDGGTTTIPVGVLAVDREQFVRELQRHLQHGSGLRPFRGPSDSAPPKPPL